MSGKFLEFAQFISGILFENVVNTVVSMEPITISAILIFGAVCSISGYFYGRPGEKPAVKEENKMGIVIVTNIKEAVEVENHDQVVIGVYLIVGLLTSMIIIFFVHHFAKSIKKHTLRRVITNGNELTA